MSNWTWRERLGVGMLGTTVLLALTTLVLWFAAIWVDGSSSARLGMTGLLTLAIAWFLGVGVFALNEENWFNGGEDE